MSHVTHVNESRHTCEWVTSHIWMSHFTHMNESRHTYEWVMPQIWMSHGIHKNESRDIWEWVTWHMGMSHVTYENESCDIWEWVTWHFRTSEATHINKSTNTNCKWVSLLTQITYKWVYLHKLHNSEYTNANYIWVNLLTQIAIRGDHLPASLLVNLCTQRYTRQVSLLKTKKTHTQHIHQRIIHAIGCGLDECFPMGFFVNQLFGFYWIELQ